MTRWLWALSVLCLCGCERGDGAPRSETQAAANSRSATAAPPPPKSAASPSPSVAQLDASDTRDAAPDAAEVSVLPALSDADGGPLPQTEDKPAVKGAFFKQLERDLFKAIVDDDPELAKPYFFPLIAYRQVKNVAKPERDWKFRLIANFERDIHQYHKQLGRDRAKTKLLGLEVPEDRAKWMKPGSEGNKLGYYRVLRSQLKYEDAQGKPRSLEITSLISWRGEWYVVHVHGFE